ncbi:MAG: sigma-54 dependent transcriptional regulator [Candidatus Cloacimonadota bacterium]|nr:sigma-54 dependent transcriptional regulator [Candidatus Cloacimonadota bacterium]
MNKRILVADDEKLIRDFIQSFFDESASFKKCKIDFATNGEEAIEFIKKKNYDIVFTDLKMPNKSGLDVLKFVAEHSPQSDAVLLTAFSSAESASKAMAYGAYEYITKPISVDALEIIINHIFERQKLVEENKQLKIKYHKELSFEKMIGNSKSIEDIIDIVKMIADTNSTVLITGESGTGKELVAEAVHTLSYRKDNNFIKINCAALPESLIESELFGFEKGSFTGAIKRTKGKFELADKGSILLDEISEMNLDLQAKLLRVIQEKEIYRIGSENSFKVDTRIIATSNKDLADEIQKGTFREDLFFRLNIVPIHLPPLRDRKNDIPLLVADFLKKASIDIGVPKKTITSSAMDYLVSYSWPGNIRELQNAIERAVITNRDKIITEDSFAFIDGKKSVNTLHKNENLNSNSSILNKTISQVEKEMIFATLKETQNNKTEAAKILGITARTLRNKLKQYKNEK